MLKPTFYLLIISIFVFLGCKKKMTESEVMSIGIPKAKKLAPFTKLAGFDSRQIALSTNEVNITGLALVQYRRNEEDPLVHKIWQHPSWKKLGHMGSITSNENGIAYTAPIPVVNTLNRSLEEMNTIYYTDENTGELKPLLKLPKPDSVANVVPFGILGLYYDDHGKKLYASTVAGSTKSDEKGTIYIIDPLKKEIIDKINGIDAFGLFVAGCTGEKRLYYGLARKPEVHSIELDREGAFVGTSKVEISLANLGPRGNDKPRRLRVDKFGNLFIFGVEFNFNLAAQTVKPETVYNYYYNYEYKKWIFANVL